MQLHEVDLAIIRRIATVNLNQSEAATRKTPTELNSIA